MFRKIRTRGPGQQEAIRFSEWLTSLTKAEFNEFADAVLDRLAHLGVLAAGDVNLSQLPCC